MSSSLIDQIRLDLNLKKLQQGKINYLEEIYQMMYDPIFKYTFSLLRNYAEAEDVTQEVFLRIEKYCHNYQSKQYAKAWIYTIAKNLVYDHQKKKKREIPFEKERLEFLIDQEFQTEETDLSFVKESLDLLTEKERQIVTLHIYGGLKHYETAKVLKIPYEKVRSIYSYALRKIEKRLKGELQK